MKRFILCALALVLMGSAVSHAQTDDQAGQNPSQYRDVEDGQVLKLAAYLITPVAMGLEWGLMRPLHYLATQTAMAPVLSGDKGSNPFFTENNNANHVPPGTFNPPALNLSNNLQASTNQTLAPAASASTTPAPPQTTSPTQAPLSGGQPALH